MTLPACTPEPWLSEDAVALAAEAATLASLLADPDIAFIFDATQLTGLVDGDPVITWPDLSPNGFDAGGGSPVYEFRNAANGINGLEAVERVPGGPASALTLPSAANNIGLPNFGLTLVAVREKAGASSRRPIIAKYSAPSPRHWQLMVGEFEATNIPPPSLSPDPNHIATGLDSAEPRIDVAVWAPGLVTALYKNGVLLGTAPTAVPSVTTDTTGVTLLGNEDSIPSETRIKLGQAIGWTRPLTGSELNVIFAALGVKWTITVTPIP